MDIENVSLTAEEILEILTSTLVAIAEESTDPGIKDVCEVALKETETTESVDENRVLAQQVKVSMFRKLPREAREKIKSDWKNVQLTEVGTKAVQRPDKIINAWFFYRWHSMLGKQYPALDVDLVEWRYDELGLYPAAVVEITSVGNSIPTESIDRYLEKIIERYHRNLQGRTLFLTSQALKCEPYIILFRLNLKQFWVYNWRYKENWTALKAPGSVVRGDGWLQLNRLQMADFIKSL